MEKSLARTMPDWIRAGWAFGLMGLLLMAMMLSSCNTTEGAGEDVSAAGDAVSDTADDVKDEM